jgi:glucan phosphoethanolaminetransferase (alkaline phosphatase superfamily)
LPTTGVPSTDHTRWALAAIALLAGLLGVVTIWVTVSVLTNRACGWMALFAAVDFALLLRLVRAPAGPLRSVLAMLVTVASCIAAAWMIAATQMGMAFGLDPFPSAAKIGPVLAWELSRLAFAGWDRACVVASVPLAGWIAWERSR